MGNSRVSYTEGTNSNAQVVEENSYYAFGLQHEGYNPTPTGLGNVHAERYKYNGKELQDELGLGWYDYQARNYDPAIGRWHNIDPLAEKYYGINPYAYVFNNPIELVDPNGMEVEFVRAEGQSRKEFRQMKREFKERNRQLMKDSKTHANNWNQLKKSNNVHKVSFNRGEGSSVSTVGKINRETGNGRF